MFKFILVVFAIFLLSPTVASADMTVTVLTIRSAEGDDEAANGLTDSIRVQANELPGLRVSDIDIRLEQMTIAHDCQPEQEGCLGRILRGLTHPTGSLVFGQMRRRINPDGYDLIVDMARYDALEDRVVHTLTIELRQTPSAESIREAATRSVTELFPDFMGSVPPEPTASGLSGTEATPSANDPGYQPTLFGHLGWVAVGLTAVSAGLMIGSMVHLHSLNEDAAWQSYRARVPITVNGVGQNVCQNARAGTAWGASDEELAHARSTCDQGEAWETAQYVLIGGTVIFGLTSIALHIIDMVGQGMRDFHGIALVPSFGPDHGYLGLTGTF